MDADVVSEASFRHDLRGGGSQPAAQAALDLGEKALCGPAFLEK
jgi:hypothetical protein